MAVSFDANMTGGNGTGGHDQTVSSGDTLSVTGLTVGASATLLVATLSVYNGGGSSVTGMAATWNGTAMNLALHASAVDGSLNVVECYIFTLVSPATGLKALVASWTQLADCYMSACSFNGTDTAVGYASADNTTASNTNSVAVPTGSTGATVAMYTNNGAPPTTNQTALWSDGPFNPGGAGSYAIGGSTTNSHTFTTGTPGTVQSLAGIHIIPPSGGSGTTISPTQGTITAVGNTPTVTPAQSTVITPIVARDHRILVPSRRIFLPTFRRAA